MKLVAVHDLTAKAYLNPVTVRTSEEAIRTFKQECNNKESAFHQHPSDFVLEELAEWDQLTGTIKPYAKPVSLATAAQLVQSSSL